MTVDENKISENKAGGGKISGQNNEIKSVFEDSSTAILEPKPEEGVANEISELSKKGYSYLKDNRVDEAINAFKQILTIEDNNNYALVGLGDSERKQNHFKDAIDYYTKCLACHPGLTHKHSCLPCFMFRAHSY